jgi:hypothetical protein
MTPVNQKGHPAANWPLLLRHMGTREGGLAKPRHSN